MTRFVFSLILAGVLAMPLTMIAGQAGPAKTVTASVTMTTSDDGRVVAVLSKNEPAFLFCIDLPPRMTQKITYTGPARVVYRPLLLGNIPAGIKIDGPENVASALAVLPSAGRGWLFLGKNEKSVLGTGDATAAGITTVSATIVRRVDWVARDGQRRGMDIEPCFVSGGITAKKGPLVGSTSPLATEVDLTVDTGIAGEFVPQQSAATGSSGKLRE